MKIAVAAVVPLVFAACSPLEPLPATPELTGYADASGPTSPTPVGPSVIYAGYNVAEPADWRGVNDGQAGN